MNYNAVIQQEQVNPNSVIVNINKLIDKSVIIENVPIYDYAIEKYTSLNAVINSSYFTIILSGTVLECILLCRLIMKDRKYQSFDTYSKTLGVLINVSKQESIFPNKNIELFSYLIYKFRNRLHPGNELSAKYSLTQVTANIVKSVLDTLIVEWGSRI